MIPTPFTAVRRARTSDPIVIPGGRMPAREPELLITDTLGLPPAMPPLRQASPDAPERDLRGQRMNAALAALAVIGTAAAGTGNPVLSAGATGVARGAANRQADLDDEFARRSAAHAEAVQDALTFNRDRAVAEAEAGYEVRREDFEFRRDAAREDATAARERRQDVLDRDYAQKAKIEQIEAQQRVKDESKLEQGKLGVDQQNADTRAREAQLRADRLEFDKQGGMQGWKLRNGYTGKTGDKDYSPRARDLVDALDVLEGMEGNKDYGKRTYKESDVVTFIETEAASMGMELEQLKQWIRLERQGLLEPGEFEAGLAPPQR